MGQVQLDVLFGVLPEKIHQKEYLIYDGIGMFGSIGGSLGLFVGFSFTGTFAWMLSWVKKIGNSISHHIENSET